MYEWNVYADGKYVGTVKEVNQDLAINAAYCKYGFEDWQVITVCLR